MWDCHYWNGLSVGARNCWDVSDAGNGFCRFDWVVNGLGRLFWATVSRNIGRLPVYVTYFVLQFLRLMGLSFATEMWVFQALILVIISCYGGGFSAMPSFMKLFGDAVGIIQGYLMTAWAVAAFVGPLILTQVYALSSSYTVTFNVFASFMLVALGVAFLVEKIKKPARLLELNYACFDTTFDFSFGFTSTQLLERLQLPFTPKWLKLMKS